jgi:uncharacterized protein
MKYFFYVLVLIVVGFTVYYAFEEEDHTLYIREIETLRKRKDQSFLISDDSPLKEESKKDFTGLNYYQVDPDFKFLAKLERNDRMEILSLGSSTGETLEYLKFGFAVFKKEGVVHRLLLLQETDPDNSQRLFLPFSDVTSAADTYGGGRYLDLDFDSRSNRIMLDFNRAYFPYCAYNESYTCAFPPVENILTIPIAAGEKN